MLEFCFYILSIIYDIISVVNNKISLVLQQIKWDKHPPDSIFVPSSAAVYLVVDLCCYWVFPSRKNVPHSSLLDDLYHWGAVGCLPLKPPACVCLCVCVYVCILVTLLDTRTVPGELKWAASPSEGGVSGSSSSSSCSSSSSSSSSLQTHCLQPVLSLSLSFFENTHTHCLYCISHSHTHTCARLHTLLGLETVKKIIPQIFEMCCCFADA